MQSQRAGIGSETRSRKQYLMPLGGVILAVAAAGLGARLTSEHGGAVRAGSAQHEAVVASNLPSAAGADQNATVYIVGSSSQAEDLLSEGAPSASRVMIATSTAEETQTQQRLANESTWRVMNGMQPLEIVDLRTRS